MWSSTGRRSRRHLRSSPRRRKLQPPEIEAPSSVFKVSVGADLCVLSLPHYDAFLARGCGRQHKAWGRASAELQEYGVSTHQARGAGGSFLLFAISSSLRLSQWLSPASAGLRDKCWTYLGFRCAPPQAILCRPHPRAKIQHTRFV